MLGLMAKKMGTTQIFDENGNQVLVTVLKVGPCYVLNKRTNEKDGYTALQLAFEEMKERYKKVYKDGKKVSVRVKPNKPMAGIFEKANVPFCRYVKEFRVNENDIDKFEVGQKLTIKDIFENVEWVDITAKSKGRGYQGVVKRHGFAGGPMSHGTRFENRGGAIGASTTPSRIFKGIKMPGQHGNRTVTIQNLKIVKIIPEENLMLVKGSVPGAINSMVMVKWAVKKYHTKGLDEMKK